MVPQSVVEEETYVLRLLDTALQQVKTLVGSTSRLTAGPSVAIGANRGIIVKEKHLRAETAGLSAPQASAPVPGKCCENNVETEYRYLLMPMFLNSLSATRFPEDYQAGASTIS